MKTISFFLFLFLAYGCTYSQIKVSIASSGTIVGTYDPNTDVITLNNTAVSDYIATKYSGQNVQGYHSEKEGGFAYFVVNVNYTVNDTTYTKIVAETLSPDSGTSQFPIPEDCEEHTCDGGCGGNKITYCSHCQFEKEKGKIIGCKCRETGFCCHTVKTVPCNK